MALPGYNGTANPLDYGAGVYPGTGIAQGGQQGRMGFVYGGLGGSLSGGRNPYSSQPAPRQVTWSKPKPIVHGGATTTAPIRHPIQRPQPIGPHGDNTIMVGPTTTVGAPAPVDPFAAFRDSSYFQDLANAQYGLDQQLNPLLSELAGLGAKNASGQTLYDVLLQRAQNQYLQDVGSKQQSLNTQGLFHSGAADQAAADMAANWLDQQSSLDKQYGTSRQNALTQQQLSLQQQFDQQRTLLDQAAAQRAQERKLGELGALYSSPIPGVNFNLGGISNGN